MDAADPEAAHGHVRLRTATAADGICSDVSLGFFRRVTLLRPCLLTLMSMALRGPVPTP